MWDWKEWTKAALIRALRTFAQSFAGMIVVGAAFTEIDWIRALSVSGVSFVLSIMTSLGGLPEVEKKPPDAPETIIDELTNKWPDDEQN